LLDEPLAALDFKLRKELQVELSNLQYELGISFVMVTHDQDEALAISSRIAVMNQGRIEQIGTPAEVYDRPSSAFVADFVGQTNLFECRVIEQDGAFVELRSSTGLAIVAAKPQNWVPIPEAVVSVRPEKIKLSTEYPNQPYNTYRGILNNVLYLGDHSQFVVDLHASENVPPVRVMLVRSNHQGDRTPPFDSQVYVSWMPEDCIALPKTTVAIS
jgi:spermidine/putrescine transport system ATP-binding protein